jgi:hypothetical protein
MSKFTHSSTKAANRNVCKKMKECVVVLHNGSSFQFSLHNSEQAFFQVDQLCFNKCLEEKAEVIY